MKIQFLGAVRQVTGSRYGIESNGARLLVDCGMFQERFYLDRNWDLEPMKPRQLTAVLLTHAHLDHCGLLPRLVSRGFRGPIFATGATADLAELVMRDAAEIQAEDAKFKQKRHRREGRQPKYPEQPLFTAKDVDHTVALFEEAPYSKPVEVAKGITAAFRDAGHILGSALIELEFANGGPERKLVFSGDLGRRNRPILRDPAVITQADYLVMESTYGDRVHDDEDVETQLADVINRTYARGGNIVVPIFAIERAQEMMYYVGRLVRSGRIPDLDVFLDSPMAASATALFARHRECFDEEMAAAMAGGQSPLKFPGLRIIRNAEESKELNELTTPALIMSTSGMCTAGRIKHHLRHNLPRRECTALFVGYQAQGTLGRQILEGAAEVRIHGLSWPVRAEVTQIQGFSGHADRRELREWLDHFTAPPRQLFLTHGEEAVTLGFAEELRKEKGWNVTVPEYRQTIELD